MLPVQRWDIEQDRVRGLGETFGFTMFHIPRPAPSNSGLLPGKILWRAAR